MSKELRSFIGLVCVLLGVIGSILVVGIMKTDTILKLILFIASLVLAYIGVWLVEANKDDNDQGNRHFSGHS